MKLRNKKTGEVWNVWSFYDGNQTINLKYFNNDEIVILEYRSLAELNEEWEDYKPTEPLIKDEKIRKFVRAWAEVNGFNVLKYLEGSRTCELSYRLKNSDGDVVMELLGGIDGLENCKEYFITELCGEEEE